MNHLDYAQMSEQFQQKAYSVLQRSGIKKIWEQAGCRVNIVGSMAMHLMAKHRDIDLHAYSTGITAASSFAIAAQIASLPEVLEIKCIPGLHTSEHCIAWHITYRDTDGLPWQFDVIHIEAGTQYDGFFERMADRITALATEEQKLAILHLKFATPDDETIHGVEYYEAVIADNVRTLSQLRQWLITHRAKAPYYWMP